jgi:spore coat protein U-like protein
MRKPKRIERRGPPRGSGVLLACVAVCALFASSAAWSATGNCSAAPTNHAFGAYDTINPTAGTSSITITCNHNGQAFTFNYTIALSSGSGSYGTRQMTGAGDTLNFNHYTSLAHTTVWGDGTAGTATVSGSISVPQGGAGTNGSQIQTVYGLIGAPQNATATAYATASPITVTLSATTAGDFPTTTATFNTNASIAAQCNMSAANLSFGTINPLSSQVDATTSLTINCTKNTSYTVGLDAGTTSGATIAQRKMANGADIMNYNLYTDAARTIIWGNSAAAPLWVPGSGAGLRTPQTLTVYGRVASGQTNLAVGNYQENTITVTLTY